MSKNFRIGEVVSTQDEVVHLIGGRAADGTVVPFTAEASEATASVLKRANGSVAASQTDSTLIAAVAAKKIRVVAALCFTNSTALDVTLQSGDTTDISSLLPLGVSGAFVLPYAEGGWFETASAEALKVTTGAGGTFYYNILYKEI